MSVPDYALPFINDTWRACDPVAATSGPHYQTTFGVPPKTLHIFETADADWKNARCQRNTIRGWLYDGNTFTELSPLTYPDFSQRPSGMYWPTGLVEFCLDLKNRRAVYSMILGPRYGRGYKRTFEQHETVSMEPDAKHLLWVS